MRCRILNRSDLPAALALLRRGFPERNQTYWINGFNRIGALAANRENQQFGYALEEKAELVGLVLTIMPPSWSEGQATICNLSSYYVDPPFRTYAPLLIGPLLKQQSLTLLNISPAPHTRPMIEAQGFRQYVIGQHFVMPLLTWPKTRRTVRSFDPVLDSDLPESALLADHASYGCMCFVVTVGNVRTPFVFIRCRIAKKFIAAAQLIYCRDIDDFVSSARPLGFHLLTRGIGCVILDADKPVPGLIGKYYEGKGTKYFRGPKRPDFGDLSYTELAIFGP